MDLFEPLRGSVAAIVLPFPFAEGLAISFNSCYTCDWIAGLQTCRASPCSFLLLSRPHPLPPFPLPPLATEAGLMERWQDGILTFFVKLYLAEAAASRFSK